jgi:hypothetical protein
MKLRLYSITALIAVIVLASCAGNDNKDYVDKSVMPTAEEKAAAVQNASANPVVQNINAMPANLQQPANMQQPGSTITMPGGKTITVPSGGPVAITPGQTNVAPQNNVVMTPVQTPVQPTAPGMNPPHGQPGHRCDISVGAPLNSKPAPATTATTVNAQPQVTMKEIPTTTKTAPGMNPPHGEAGHRCDIAVGAPLNSKPVAPATVTTSNTPASIVPPPLLTPAKTDSSKN